MAASDAASPVTLLLRRAVLLAVIAGFLGMHVLSGSHGRHSQAPHSGAGHAAADHPAASAPADLHGEHASHDAGLPTSAGVTAVANIAVTNTAVTPASVTDGGTQVPPSCVCRGGCAEKPAAHLGCTPSPAGATLSAPQPGTTLLAMQPWPAALTVRAAGYVYMPGSRTPRELSISRT